VRLDPRIYAASADTLLAVVKGLPADAQTVVLVGHNPGIENLVTLLTGEDWPMKTAAVAVLSWPGSWSDPAPGRANLEARATPGA
jgi:phosphohistidine phosphatase